MSARIQKIKETYTSQFQKKLEQENINISVDSAWDILTSADPTKNKKNVRWLVEAYINKGYLWEDIMGGPTSKVFETLVEFDKYKRHLEASERSLMKYDTLGSLWASIKPYVGQLTAGEEKKSERDKAYAECEVIVDREDGLKIVVPRTQYAAKWFGRGTRWCTAAEKNNLFYHYAKDAPLFIIMMPGGEKLQLWSTKYDIQFMDENDDTITPEYVDENKQYLQDILKITTSPLYRRDLNTIDEYLALLKDSKSMELEYAQIPRHLINKKACEKIIEQCPDALYELPGEFITMKLWEKASIKRPHLFHNMPSSSITPDFCVKMAKAGDRGAFQNTPFHLKTQEMALKMFNINPYVIRDIPDGLVTQEMADTVIKDEKLKKDLIKYIPHHRIPEDLLRDCCNKGYIPFLNVPEEYRTDECISNLIQKGGIQIFELQDQGVEITRDYYKHFLKTHQISLSSKDFPKEYIDEEMLAFTAEHGFYYPDFTKFVPRHNLPDYIVQKALKKHARALELIHDDEKTYEMCLHAIKLDGSLLYLVPDKFIDEEICLLGLKADYDNIMFAPYELITPDLCLKAIHQVTEEGDIGELLKRFPDECAREAVIRYTKDSEIYQKQIEQVKENYNLNNSLQARM